MKDLVLGIRVRWIGGIALTLSVDGYWRKARGLYDADKAISEISRGFGWPLWWTRLVVRLARSPGYSRRTLPMDATEDEAWARRFPE